MYKFPLLTGFSLSVATLLPVTAVQITYTDLLTVSDTSENIPWVLGSEMWESLDSGAATAVSQSGLTFFDTRDISLLSWTYGDLELSSYLSPTPSSAGFEIYTEVDGTIVPFEMFYDGELVVTGDADFVRTDALNSSDASATGSAQVTMTAPGADSTLYDELMSLSGGSGLLSFVTSNFAAVTPNSFSVGGVMTVVPEPSSYAGLLGLAAFIGCLSRRKRHRN